MGLFNRRKDFSQQSPKTPIIQGVLSVVDTPTINLTYNASTQVLQADLQPIITTGTYGSSTFIPVFSINQYGQITTITQVAVSGGGGGTYTVNNGLTENPANNFQLGGALIQDTVISSTGFKLDLISNVNFPGYALGVQNSGTGTGIFVQSVGGNGALEAINNNGSGVVGTSANGYGVRGVSNGNGVAFQAAQTKPTTSTVETIAQLVRETSSLGANGIGGSLDFYVEADNPSSIPISHKLISKWTNATFASRVSQFEIEGVNNAISSRLLALTGQGQLILDKYGLGTFGGTLQNLLGVTSSGNVIETSIAQVRGLPVSMYNQEAYLAGNATVAVEYVPSTGKLYIGSNAGNVHIYDVATGVLLGIVSVVAPSKIKYIASINEVWVTSTSQARIERISTSNTLLSPAITTGITAGGADILEYSSTKVFVLLGTGTGRIMVINPSTLSWVTDIFTNVQPNGFGMAWNQNPSSAQNGFVVITGFNSVAILNPATNTISTVAVNPGSSLSAPRGIVYVPSIDKYYVASMGNNTIVCLDVASATTFTVNSTIRNTHQVADIAIDESIGYLFAVSNISNTGLNTGVLGVKAIPYLAVKPNLTFQTQLTAGGTRAGYITMDTVNRRLFAVGVGASPGFCNEIKYIV